jgi:hypothetical protein
MEEMGAPWGRGPAVPVNRYSLNPILDYLRATLERPSYSSEPAPEMFSNGPLPIFAASGVDIDVLRWVPYYVRHSAAMTTDPARVWAMTESEEPSNLAIPEGEAAWRSYIGRCWRWAMTPPGDTGPAGMSMDDYENWTTA